MNNEFWQAIDSLASSGRIVIDRPKGSSHPKYTTSMDGGGIDVWRGSLTSNKVDSIICTVDLMKKDSEIKLLMGCTEEETKIIYEFHNNSEFMKGILIKRCEN